MLDERISPLADELEELDRENNDEDSERSRENSDAGSPPRDEEPRREEGDD
jgi:pre-mRNA-splicing factor 38A